MIIGGFQPISLSDFPRTPAAVVFTQGCNWRCPFCHNKSLWQSDAQESMSVDQLFVALAKRQGVLPGIVFSGGEPTLHDDLLDVIQAVKKMGYSVKLDSNGSHPEKIEALLAAKLLDYIAMDIKAPWSKYSLLAGVNVDLELVRQTIHLISTSGIEHEFRTTHPPHLLDKQDLHIITTLLPNHSLHKIQTYRDIRKQTY